MTEDAASSVRPDRTSLAAESVSVAYQGVIAVDQVSLDVRQGELCGLIGPNGSGKSSLLGVLSRLIDPSAGRIHVDTRDYTHRKPADVARLGIARTFQTVRLVPNLSVIENVMLGYDARGKGLGLLPNVITLPRGRRWERQARSCAREKLDLVGLRSTEQDGPPGALPFGFQRRVELARALAFGPHVLLLDEPTAGMSEHERHEIGELLLRVKSDGVSVLIVEHNLGLINRICDWLFVLSEGRIIAEGAPDVVSRDPVVATAYLGTAAGEHASN